ncbi:Aladin [Pseudolycoriella hygida]|uniref:Aladin n=1 Tax=Pseudolycoriella hygida TaxID=35572 RepID=A0A9Q0RYQ8_9DIPT|nr:Aladin [Pseudolycoriella hygida]
MVSLRDFSSFPKPGEISLYEKDGQLCSLPAAEVDLTNFAAINLSAYPEINISRELHSHATTSHDENKTVLIQVYEPLIKQLTRTFIENGFEAALEKAANPESETNTVAVSIARFVLRVVNICKTVQYYYHPYRKDRGIFSISKFAQTRDWSRSFIRVMRWHPNIFKLAVAACDDSIRVYTDEKSTVVVLKVWLMHGKWNILQKCITSMEWRPLSHNELAVGCENGIIIWNITNVRTGKPITRYVNLTHRNHSPIISLEWDKAGMMLASASTSDSDILIWCPDSQRNDPLKRVGPPSSLLKFSPDGERLFTSTVGSVFRVWNTHDWLPERWTLPNGTIQSAAWSPCGGYLLFVTSEEPILYSLQFIEQQLFATASLAKQALPIADLSKIELSNQSDIGGQPQSLAWDSKGQHLAISFKDCSSIALFLTSVNKNMINIAPDCFIVGIGTTFPSYICFQEPYKDSSHSVLTIGWSSGVVQYFPFV